MFARSLPKPKLKLTAYNNNYSPNEKPLQTLYDLSKTFRYHSQAVWRHNGKYTGLSGLFVSPTRSVKLSTLSILTSKQQFVPLYRII